MESTGYDAIDGTVTNLSHCPRRGEAEDVEVILRDIAAAIAVLNWWSVASARRKPSTSGVSPDVHLGATSAGQQWTTLLR